MRKPIIIFVSIVTISVIIIGCLIFKAFNPTVIVNEHYQDFYLNTDKRHEADSALINYNFGSYICAAYKFDGKSNIEKTGADVFVYVINKDSIHVALDTILLLDTRLKRPWQQHVEDYFEYIEPQKNIAGCMVSIPQRQIEALTKYKFLYADVELVSED